MIDDKNRTDVQDREADAGRDDGAAVPIVPLPIGGFSAAGQLGATAGNINTTSGAAAPLVGGMAAFAAAENQDADRFEDADMQIADRVEEALAADGRLSGADIAVAVAEGTVELTGSVPSERVRETAGQVCAHVPGVRAVENRLTVL